MKFDGPDPQRIDELEPSELGDLVRSARRKGPSDGALGRMTQKLAAGGALTAATHTATSRAGLSARLGGYTLGALVMLSLAGAFFVRQTKTSAPPPQPTPIAATTPPPASAAVEAPSTPVDALPSSAATAPVARSLPPRATVEPPQAIAARAPSHSNSNLENSNPSKNPSPPAPSSSPEVEFAIVRRAQDALVADPSRALAIVEEHARLYPSGELVQEREVVAVEALARLGRREDAKSRAGALLGRFPRTPYVVRLERALGEPITLPSKTPR